MDDKQPEILAQEKMQKQKTDKFLLNAEIALIVVGIAILIAFVMIASYIELATWLRICIVVLGTIACFILFFISLKIEHIAGYYKCGCCNHKYIRSLAYFPLIVEWSFNRFLNYKPYFRICQ